MQAWWKTLTKKKNIPIFAVFLTAGLGVMSYIARGFIDSLIDTTVPVSSTASHGDIIQSNQDGSNVLNTGDGTVNIHNNGIPLEQHEASLKRHETELKAKLKQAHSENRQVLEDQLLAIQQQLQNSRQSQKGARDAERLAKIIRTTDIKLRFFESEGVLKINSFRASSLPVNSHFEISQDGENFDAEFTNGYPIDLSKHDLLFRVVSSEGKELAIINKTGKLAEEIERLRKKITTKLAHSGSCTVMQCRIEIGKFSAICNALTKSASLTLGDKSIQLNLKYCNASVKERQGGLYITAEELPFLLIPSQPIKFSLGLKDGTTVEHEIIPVISKNQDSRSWVLLPLAKNQTVTTPAPLAFGSFKGSDSGNGAFNFILGSGHGSKNYDYRILLVDLDGRGLVGDSKFRPSKFFARYNHRPRVYHPSSSSSDKNTLPLDLKRIGFGIRVKDQPDLGPWWYEIDLIQLAQKGYSDQPKPAVVCNGLCLPNARTAFINVDRLEYGPDPGNYTRSLDINFSILDLLTKPCMKRQGNCPPFVIEYPEGWSDMYTRIRMKDGTWLNERRLQLKQ